MLYLERLVQLSRGVLEGDELLAALQHLEECDDCAREFRVIVLLRAVLMTNPGRRYTSGDPRRLM